MMKRMLLPSVFAAIAITATADVVQWTDGVEFDVDVNAQHLPLAEDDVLDILIKTGKALIVRENAPDTDVVFDDYEQDFECASRGAHISEKQDVRR